MRPEARGVAWPGPGPWLALALAVAVTCVLVTPLSLAQSTGGVAGRVLWSTGEPVAGANISLSPGGTTALSGSDGSFHLAAEPGHYLLRAAHANRTVEETVQVLAGRDTVALLLIPWQGEAASGVDAFPFVFLGASMVAVAVGGFYVNRRMAETGIDLEKGVVGGAGTRKPFRRRRRPKARPPSG